MQPSFYFLTFQNKEPSEKLHIFKKCYEQFLDFILSGAHEDPTSHARKSVTCHY
jgi:hypothetical protein